VRFADLNGDVVARNHPSNSSENEKRKVDFVACDMPSANAFMINVYAAVKRGAVDCTAALAVAAALLANGTGNIVTASVPRPRLRSGRNSAHC
jgi:hypothetical protein